MGAGKSHVLRAAGCWGVGQGFVMLDPDAIKFALPEMRAYIARNPNEAGTLTHLESSYLIEIALHVVIQRR